MIHQLAAVDRRAKIGKDVTIEPFTTIAGDVEIGDGTWIGPNVTIMDGARIGKNCRIFPGAVIGAIPQDLKFRGEETTAEIGDGTTIREFVTVNRGTAAKGRTIVGSNCLIMAYVHVAHDCLIGDNVILVNGVNLGGEVIVDDYAIISANSLIHQFCRIGAHTILAGNSLVGKDVPPYVKAARYPLSFAGVNSIGLRRRNFCNDKINAIQDIYRVVYNRGMNVSQATAYIEAEMPASKERDEILLFIRNSKRGIIKGYFDKSESDVAF